MPVKHIVDYARDWYEMIANPQRWLKQGRPRKKRTGTPADLIFRI